MGATPSKVDTIDYVTISTLGNATDFGDTTVASGYRNNGSCGDGSRGVFAGGQTTPTNVNVIDFARSLFGFVTAGEDEWDIFSWQNDLCKEYYSMQLENYSNLNFNILENKTKVLETIVDTYNIDNEQRKGENENSHSS